MQQNNRFWNLLSKKMSGEASHDEILELEFLLKEYPELVYSAEQIENLWKLEPVDCESELSFQQHLNQLNKKGIYLPDLDPLNPYDFKPPKKIRNQKFKFSILTVLIIAIIAMIVWQARKNSEPELLVYNTNFTSEVSTPMGNRTRLVLPDSTVVWLNSGSKLNYNEHFGISNRNTTLSGEAYFDVKKSNTPFIIQAKGVHIKVLGTAFNVKSYPDERTTETSLVRGEVEITIDKRPGEKIILRPNEKLIVANELNTEDRALKRKTEPIVILGSITHSDDNSIIETSWVNNKLIFQDESFAELAVKMERWFGVNIEFANEKVARERLSGTFTMETIHEALEILQMTTDFNFTMKYNSIIITD